MWLRETGIREAGSIVVGVTETGRCEGEMANSDGNGKRGALQRARGEEAVGAVGGA